MRISDNTRKYILGLGTSVACVALITIIISEAAKFKPDFGTENSSCSMKEFCNILATLAFSFIIGFICHHIFWVWSQSKIPVMTNEQIQDRLGYLINDLKAKIETLENIENKTTEQSTKLNKLKEEITKLISEYNKYDQPPQELLDKYNPQQNNIANSSLN